MLKSFQPSPLLRYALVGDAVASAGTGLLMAAGARVLTGLLGLPENLLRSAGLFLLGYAAVVACVGLRATIRRAAVWAIIGLNAVWAIDSLILLAGPWVAATTLGTVFVLFQAIVVLGFAETQYFGLRRTGAMATAAA